MTKPPESRAGQPGHSALASDALSLRAGGGKVRCCTQEEGGRKPEGRLPHTATSEPEKSSSKSIVTRASLPQRTRRGQVMHIVLVLDNVDTC